MRLTQIIDDIVRREGGYVDHPADRGGPTKHGITIKTLGDFLGRFVTADDVRDLTETAAREIYITRYVIEPGFHKVADERLQALLVDSGVLHGPKTACKWLQVAVGTVPDGVIGPKTLEALSKSERTYERVLGQRISHTGRIITRDSSQAVFAHGWCNRIAEFLR